MIFIFFTLGACSMWFISLAWADKVQVVGIPAASGSGLMLILWGILAQHHRIGH